MSGWQPIETAPKDGTVIIATDHRCVYAVAWNPSVKDDRFPWVIFDGAFNHMPSGCCDDEDAERIEVNGWMSAAPTHWMPLPEPPEPGQ